MMSDPKHLMIINTKQIKKSLVSQLAVKYIDDRVVFARLEPAEVSRRAQNSRREV
jgi:hypothetical protein